MVKQELAPRTVDAVFEVGQSVATSQVDRRRDVLPGNPTRTDPFIMLSEDWFSEVGFDWHPHRGFETVTYVVSGRLEHRDNAGGHGVLGPGDVQWVTTGRGVIHSEMAVEKEPVHTLQLWLNLPSSKKMIAPRYVDLPRAEMPAFRQSGVEARVYAGNFHGLRGRAETIWPAGLVEVRLHPAAHYEHELPGNQAAFFYVLEGEVRVGEDQRCVEAGEVAWFDAGPDGDTGVSVIADRPTVLLAYCSVPIREPLVAYGPFVMNHRREIHEAIRDYQRGDFGPVPD